jgi:hypothetical protein
MAACAGVLVLMGCAAPTADPGGNGATDAPSNDSSSEAPSSEALSCDEFASVITESLPLMFVMLDTDITPPEVASAMRELSDRWSGFTPPAEIASDWPAMTEWADTYAGAWEDVPADADQQQAFEDIQAEFGELDEASDAAFERVSAYIEENCPPE